MCGKRFHRSQLETNINFDMLKRKPAQSENDGNGENNEKLMKLEWNE